MSLRIAIRSCLLLAELGTKGLNHLQPLLAVLARAHVAQAFFLSGLTKIRDWETTLALFNDEYQSVVNMIEGNDTDEDEDEDE